MPTWGTYEDGLVRILPDEALKLPLNWIYEGKMTNLPRTFRQKSASSRPKLRVGLVSKEVPRCPASFRLPPRNADFAPLSATKWREMRGDRMLELAR